MSESILDATILFKTLDTGESIYAWYQHPELYPSLVVLTGAKHYVSPEVEWLNKYDIPKELRGDDYILADELPGSWADCPVPKLFHRVFWEDK